KVNRRKVLQGLAVAPLAARGWIAEAAEKGGASTLFVGTQTKGGSKGIYAYRWDAAKGEPVLIGLAAETENPTFLAVSPEAKYLYAANEVDSFNGTKGGGVSSFIVDAKAGKLTAINAVSAKGTGTCHVAVDKTGKAVFCANYSGGSAASFHVKGDGELTDAVSFFQYTGHGPKPDQQMAHAHRATPTPDNRQVLINDLGLDCIHIYDLDAATAKLTPHDPPEWKSEPGTGPRALRFHPNGKWAYCVLELSSEVAVLRWDARAGSLTTLQTVKLTPEGYAGKEPHASEIVLDRAGKFAYASDRFDDVLVSFRVDPATGMLTKLGTTKYGGKTPRHIALDPTERWLLVANQDSDNISVVKRDTKTGLLAETGKEFPIVKPQCLVFV
ncbi:MAG TPA: lactonase family protein, partial [Terracidiphilus sp.]|nr:lactonase family protein [Terracidiphilus sp.]